MIKQKNTDWLQDLEEQLLQIEKPSLNSEKKALLKAKVLRSVRAESELEILVSKIKELVSEVRLSSAKRVSVKERLFAEIEHANQKRYFWRNLFVFHKKLASATLLVAMSFGLLSFVNVDTRVVWADSFSAVTEFSGEVSVTRDGKHLEVYEGMEVKERDKMLTGADGWMNIKFFDDSVTRLAADTELEVNKLFNPGRNNVKSEVQVSLHSGSAWNKVVNLVEDSSFVVEANEVEVKTKKAGFNVSLLEDKVQVDVYKNVVEVASEGEVEDVGSGEKVVANEVIEKNKIADIDMEEDWVVQNLESDEAYVAEVEVQNLEKRKEIAGKTILDSAALLLTFDDVKRARLELDLLEKDFIAAQVEVVENEDVVINGVMSDFKIAVEDFYELVEEVSLTDEVYAAELSEYIDEKILAHKKYLVVTDVDSPFYQVKEVIDDLELFTVDGVEEVAALKERQALDEIEIVEAEELEEKEVEEVEEVEQPVEQKVATPQIEESYGVRIEHGRPLDPLL